MTGPDGKRPLKEGTPDYVKYKYENEYKNKYVKAKRVCFGNLLMFGLLSLVAVTIFVSVFIVVLTDPDALTVDMASTIDKEPSYSVLTIWLIALAGPGGVMLLYPKWKKYAPPIIPYDGGPWYHPLSIHTICMLLPLPITILLTGPLYSVATERLAVIGVLVVPATWLVGMPFFGSRTVI